MSKTTPRQLPGNFLHHPSDAACAAYEQLRRVATVEGPDEATRVFATAVAPTWRAQFAQRYGVTESHRGRCIQRLLGKRCGAVHCVCRPPADDHPSLWLSAGSPVLWVSQPYGLRDRNVREIVAFCDHYGLEFSIDAWVSWHFPGRVLTVVYSRPGVTAQLAAAARDARA